MIDQEKVQQAQARLRRAAEAAERRAEQERAKSEREQLKAEVEAQKDLAERKTAELDGRVGLLQTVLKRGLQRSPTINYQALRQRHQPIPFDPSTQGAPPIEPRWEDFAPAQPGLLSRALGGGRRHQQEVEARRADFERARVTWWQAVQVHQQLVADAARNHERNQDEERRRIEQQNRDVDAFAERVARRERVDVQAHIERILSYTPWPPDFPRVVEAVFDPRAEQIAVQFELPPSSCVPEVRAYKYVQARKSIDEVARPVKESGELYRSVVAQVALLCIRDVLSGDRAINGVAFNGHVHHTNPATGKREYPCLISLNVDRERFEDLVLEQVQPEVCLRHLEARVSPHPYELEPIMPILDFDLTKFAFIKGMDAVSTLDSRPDLMDMDPTTFEHLIRQVFLAKGEFEGWTTTQSKDDGVDAVITNKTSLVGGLVVVQAKRYKTVIGPAHVRELVGTMDEKRAGRGILVTTSWFTAGAWTKARENARIELIDGSRLVALIKENLGKDVLIGIDRPPRAPGGTPS